VRRIALWRSRPDWVTIQPRHPIGTKLAGSAVKKNDDSGSEAGSAALEESVAELSALARALPDRINADPEKVEQGLARLVLTVIELLRRVLEHQAVRRMDGGSLTDQEVEQLGLALMKLSQRMDEMKETFGLSDDDLSIDLGPLGELR
jgi:hypothetical protein